MCITENPDIVENKRGSVLVKEIVRANESSVFHSALENVYEEMGITSTHLILPKITRNEVNYIEEMYEELITYDPNISALYDFEDKNNVKTYDRIIFRLLIPGTTKKNTKSVGCFLMREMPMTTEAQGGGLLSRSVVREFKRGVINVKLKTIGESCYWKGVVFSQSNTLCWEIVEKKSKSKSNEEDGEE